MWWLVIILLMYVFCDVNYYFRVLFVILNCSRLFNGSISVYEKSTIYGICTTNDVGIFLDHMNNARYHREIDFARFTYYRRSGIYKKLKENKGSHLLGSSFVRFRKKIDFLAVYKIESQMIYHDDRALYQRHSFITLKDNFVRAVILTQEVIVGLGVGDLLRSLGEESSKLDCPKDINLWLEAIEETKSRLCSVHRSN